MAEPSAKRVRLSAEDVIGMLEDEYESEDDNDEDYNEVMCEGSDDDFYDFDKDEVPPQDLDFYPPRDLHEDTEER